MAIIYGLKVNLSVTMVSMLNNTAIKSLTGEKTVAAAGAVENSSCGGTVAVEVDITLFSYKYDNILENKILLISIGGYK